jgi:hypothetical protein
LTDTKFDEGLNADTQATSRKDASSDLRILAIGDILIVERVCDHGRVILKEQMART